jgi:[ribosomal protein S5]-alanine N-acetyltransferase
MKASVVPPKFQPTLDTARLRLRPLSAQDAPVVQQLLARREVADSTMGVAFDCSQDEAGTWILSQVRVFAANMGASFGLALRSSGELIGAIGLHNIDLEHAQAEIGFWIGVPWWGMGFATEAAGAVLRYGFEERHLNRICGYHMERNSGARHVLEKIGMRREGVLRARVRKLGVFEDVGLWAILVSDWQGMKR